MTHALMVLTLVTVMVLIGACQSSAPAASSPAATATTAPVAAAKTQEKEAPKPPGAKDAPAEKTVPKEAAPKAPSGDAARALYDAAKNEGQVIWQNTAFGEDLLTALIGSFETRYPGIKVSSQTTSSGPAVTRLLSESAAGRVSIDVGMGAAEEMVPLTQRDLLVRSDWTSISGVPAGNILLDSRFVVAYDLAHGWIYNTRLVTPADVPKTWGDLLSPKWKGRKLAVPVNGATGIEAMRILGKWDAQTYKKFLDDLKAQELIVESSGAGTAQRIADGQTPLGIFPTTLLPELLQKGAPLELAPLGPLVAKRFGFYTAKGVPHPNAGKLFMAWLGSAEAGKIFDKWGRGPATPCSASEVAKLLCAKNIEALPDDGAQLSDQVRELLKLSQDTLGLVPSK